ncbi:nucleoside hydrolase-like domain-containing protein [Rhodopirellula sp. P2]|uniref:nucleoside hydrolase-like domain-containing protein n=1 Tax=Rhodopirellula sp. P2 TaxID=2127060 RepID=UPI0023688A7D|nr:nucleoside hydrolase-like domain-containing protein [Rhodopirellula sp. P2]WDQ15165.1 DUF1593 domain-containing protein [Rhodopirellula sp. P2]
MMMRSQLNQSHFRNLCICVWMGGLCLFSTAMPNIAKAVERPRILVTTDGEIDDECSMVRFLLYANEFDIEGIVTSSSQYHWWQHTEADTYDGTIEISNANQPQAEFVASSDANGKTVHVICEVTDSGTPQMTRYQRVVNECQ